MKTTIMKAPTLILSLLLIMLGSQSLASEGKSKKNMMKDLDTDGDGAVSFQEFQNGPDRRFQMKDLNSDGVITLAEMQQHQAEREAERQSRANEELEERFATLDGDGDGMITLDEAQRGIFDRIDSNGDGVITRKEGRKARKHHKRRRHSEREQRDQGEG